MARLTSITKTLCTFVLHAFFELLRLRYSGMGSVNPGFCPRLGTASVIGTLSQSISRTEPSEGMPAKCSSSSGYCQGMIKVFDKKGQPQSAKEAQEHSQHDI